MTNPYQKQKAIMHDYHIGRQGDEWIEWLVLIAIIILLPVLLIPSRKFQDKILGKLFNVNEYVEKSTQF